MENFVKNSKNGFTPLVKPLRSNPLLALLRSRIARFSHTEFRNPVAHSSGFTLAEVLIVVTVLGVIALVVIPGLINSYTQRVTVTKVKKMYSTLTSAYNQYMAMENHELPSGNSDSNKGAKAVGEALIYPNFEIIFDADFDATKKQEIMGTSYMSVIGTTEVYKDMQKNVYNAVQLKDGSVIIYSGVDQDGADNRKAEIFYDVNGKKGPNKLGADLFQFNIYGTAVVPGTCKNNLNKSSGAENCADRCDLQRYNKSTNASGCTAYIILYGNMNYLK